MSLPIAQPKKAQSQEAFFVLSRAFTIVVNALFVCSRLSGHGMHLWIQYTKDTGQPNMIHLLTGYVLNDWLMRGF